MSELITNRHTGMARDVHEGLSADSKWLSSRYFYDHHGDKLFQKIMSLPEYYLTDCEYEIFDRQKGDILKAVASQKQFDLVELGAGDGYKTKLLLEHFLGKVDFKYFPVDISASVLSNLEADLREQFPSLKVTTLNHEYFEAIEKLNKMDDAPKVILFLGSNIGNFKPKKALQFMKHLFEVINSGDQLICGIDLKKDPRTILRAYNDESGITKAFNLNLLRRINRELGGNFNLENFDHFPTYDPKTGECRSYLMSTVEQDVFIDSLNRSYHFDHSEPIHMEISRKYSLKEIDQLARASGFVIKKNFLDSKGYFVDSLWVKP